MAEKSSVKMTEDTGEGMSISISSSSSKDSVYSVMTLIFTRGVVAGYASRNVSKYVATEDNVRIEETRFSEIVSFACVMSTEPISVVNVVLAYWIILIMISV